MAVSPVSSRLEVLQARFQQKQMQEKEQKLLQLYDQQQHRAYQVVQRGSAASTGSVTEQRSVSRTTTTTQSTSTTQGGKVRQMFDERRHITAKGIDRSYLLDPLDNKPKKQNAARNGHAVSKTNPKNTVIRQTVSVRRTATADINSNINGGKPIVSYQEEVSHESFEGDDHNDNDPNEGDCSNQNGVHIEEILNDDTVARNRMLAKIHLMEYDGNLKHRIDRDLNSEKFPDDLLVDVPDKLPRKSVMKKMSQAETRLERFKNANIKRSTASVTVAANRPEPRKPSEPMFPASKTSPRASRINSKTTDTEKAKRSDTKPSLRPVPIQSPDEMGRKTPTCKRPNPMKPKSPTSPVKPAVPTETVTPVRSARSAEPELVQTCKPLITDSESSARVPNIISPEPASERSANSVAKDPVRRRSPPSPTKRAGIATRRGSAGTMSPEPRPVRRLPQSASRKHEAVDATDMRTPIDTSSSGIRSNPDQIQADDGKSLVHSPVAESINGDSRRNKPTRITEQPLRKSPVERPPTAQNQRLRSTTRSPSPRPSSTLSTASSTTSSAKGSSSPESNFRRMASKAKNPIRSPGTTSTSGTRGQASSGNGSTVLSSDALVSCKVCGRRFAQDRISPHEKICAKTGQKKRKQFDTVLHRVQGTELEAYTKKGTSAGRQAERLKAKNQEQPQVKSNWRRKHEDFINAIRSAKQVQAHLAAGGKLSDLPPPPVSDTSDYIQCPHCGRKFNQGAADRHIPKCATMMHNKPKPRAPPKPRR